MNNLISVLNKLPDITFQVIPPPIFKVPEIPKYVQKNIKYKSKVVTEKEVTLKKQGNNLMDRNFIVIDNLKTGTKSNSISSSVKNNSNQIIKKHTNTITFEKYSCSEQKNMQRTSSPNISLNKTQNTSIVSHKMKKITYNDSVINNTNVKINKSHDENYKLMDISTKGKIDIISSFQPLDFNDIYVPKYSSFIEGLNKLSKNNLSIEKLQNSVGKESLAEPESTTFSDISDYVKTSIMLNNVSDIHTDLDSFIQGNVSLDIIQNEKHVNSEFVDTNMNVGIDDNESKIEKITNSKNMSIVLKDEHLLQEMRSIFNYNFIEKTEDRLKDFRKPLQEILPNTVENYSIAHCNKNTIKKKSNITNLYKKQKTNCENKN